MSNTTKEELEEGFIHDQYGYCYYLIDSQNPYACIYNLYTEPKYRRQGYAKVHLQYVIQEIRKYGHTGEIAIEADPRENSIAVEKLAGFYKDLGLYVTNTEPEPVTTRADITREVIFRVKTIIEGLRPYVDNDRDEGYDKALRDVEKDIDSWYPLVGREGK
jgi:hypothetical protein